MISSVCGLGFEVDIPLAGLAGLRAPRRVDVRALLGAMPAELERFGPEATQEIDIDIEPDETGAPSKRVWRLGAGRFYRIAYSDGATIVVDGHGERIWATWTDALCVEDVAAYVLGPVLGLVLRLRGITCLHASAVAIGGRAIALVGPSGSGKSSAAAAFARLGHPVLSDDLVALRDAGDGLAVAPALPRVHLWPESSQALFGSPEALPRLTPGWDKRFLDLNQADYRFQREPLPLAAVYFLGERHGGDDGPRIAAVPSREALLALLADTPANDLVGRSHRAQEFATLSRLVEGVALRRVAPCTDFARIPELCEAIVRDLEAIDV